MRSPTLAFFVTVSLASTYAFGCKSPLLPDHLTSDGPNWTQTFWVAKIVDIDRGEVTVAATGDFGHLNEIGKPVTLQFIKGEQAEARCAMHFRHGHAYLLRSVQHSNPYLLSRFNWPGAIDSEDPLFQVYVQDLKAAHGR